MATTSSEGGQGEGMPASGSGESHPLSFVVRRMNEELGTDLRLHTFSKISGRELLKLLDDVFRKLSPNNAQYPEFDSDSEEEQNGRMTTALQALNYQPANPNTFMENFTKGEKDLIHSILYWVLGRFPESKERLYLAQYLVPLPVPEDLRATDDGVREVWEQWSLLASEFKETHWNIRKLKQAGDAGQLIKQAQGQEAEREQLKGALKDARRRLHKLPASQKLLENCAALLEATQRNGEVKRSVVEQRAHLETSERGLKGVEERLRQVRRDFGEQTIDQVIEGMREEVALNRELLAGSMPNDIQDHQEKVANLSAVLGEQLNSQQLRRSVEKAEREIRELEARHTPEMTDDDRENLSLYQKQASIVAHREVRLQTEHEKLQQEQLQVERALREREREMAKIRGANIPRGKDFQQYAASLRAKCQKYRQMKTELQGLQGELGVLRRTEQVLEIQNEDASSRLEEMEEARGMPGYHLMDLDEVLESLGELRKGIEETLRMVRERRNAIAPQILVLRDTRGHYKEVEQVWEKKREAYLATKGEMDSEISALQSERDRYQAECRSNESLAHQLRCQIKIAQVNTRRADDEKKGFQPTDPKRSFSGLLDSRIHQLEQVSRDLQAKKKEIEGKHEDNLVQMRWFKNLSRLSDAKLQCARRSDRPQQLAGQDLGTLSGVDRLVL